MRELTDTIAELADGEFAEGHEQDAKVSRKIPKRLIGFRLSQAEAVRLLKSIE